MAAHNTSSGSQEFAVEYPTAPAFRGVPPEAVDHVVRILFEATLQDEDAVIDSADTRIDERLLWERRHEEELLETVRRVDSVANRVFLEQVAVGLSDSIQQSSTGRSAARFGDLRVYFENPQHWLAQRAHTALIVPPKNSDLSDTLHVKRGFEVSSPEAHVKRSQKRPVPVWIIGEKKVLGTDDYEYIGLTPKAHLKTKWVRHADEEPLFYNGSGEDWSTASHILSKNDFSAVSFRLPESLWLLPFDEIPNPEEIHAARDTRSNFLAYQLFYCSEEIPNTAHQAADLSLLSGITDEQVEEFHTPWYLTELAGHFGVSAMLIEETAKRLKYVKGLVREEVRNGSISTLRFETMGRGKYDTEEERRLAPWGEAITEVLRQNGQR